MLTDLFKNVLAADILNYYNIQNVVVISRYVGFIFLQRGNSTFNFTYSTTIYAADNLTLLV